MKPKNSNLSRCLGFLTLGWTEKPEARLLLRRGFLRLVAAGLRARSRPLPMECFSSILIFSPHPDDESFGCGGTIAGLVQAGTRAFLSFLTDGSGSHPSHPTMSRSDIQAKRRAEAKSASASIGLSWDRVAFLDEPDGTLSQLGPDRKRRLVALLAVQMKEIRPDAVLLPCHRDGSSEHEAAFALVQEALDVQPMRPRVLEYPIWSWWNPRLLIKPLFLSKRVWRIELRGNIAAKARAISCYGSQTHPVAPEKEPALPFGFASLFLGGEEFLFEH